MGVFTLVNIKGLEDVLADRVVQIIGFEYSFIEKAMPDVSIFKDSPLIRSGKARQEALAVVSYAELLSLLFCFTARSI